MEDPTIAQIDNKVVVKIEVLLDSSKEKAPMRRSFKYTEEAELNAANDMKKVANSLATQIMFSKKGNKVFIQVSLDENGNPEENIYSYYDQLTQNGKNI